MQSIFYWLIKTGDGKKYMYNNNAAARQFVIKADILLPIYNSILLGFLNFFYQIQKLQYVFLIFWQICKNISWP